ncbi:4'-phosphopantetheinyl transferase family protein [Vitreimonas flagellata]|uniref:4'-phosphopantetheinyl transferase family protein n=1 Tax=Vitreimonas flagellata TaxID=2560861 RepID=UPI001EF9A23E|nr:4'-phosphopantetheinyl transferase superfamily protein [Vitreimonas flagellata]
MASLIKIYVWPLDPTTPAPAAELATLSEKETARMARFVFDKDRFRFGQSHARMRALLGAHLGVGPSDLSFGENAHGKPLLAGGPFFNLSHSHNLAALAISDDLDLGLDVEHVRAIEGPQIARRFFSPQECAALNAYAGPEYENAFYRCWTRKEAYVKAQGEGLGIPLDSFDVTIDADTPPRLLRIDGDDAAAWQMCAFDPAPNYQGAVALRTAEAISFEVITSA